MCELRRSLHIREQACGHFAGQSVGALSLVESPSAPKQQAKRATSYCSAAAHGTHLMVNDGHAG